jgi:hypothetical protein
MNRAIFAASIRSLLSATLGSTLLAIAGSASAATVSGTYSGFISEVDPALSSQFSKNDHFTFNFSYSGTGTDIDPYDPNIAIYLDLTQTVSVSVGTFAVSGNGGDLRVYNDDPFDLLFLNFTSPIAAPSVNGYTLDAMTFLGIGDPSLLPSEAPPDHYIPASAFYLNSFRLLFSKEVPSPWGGFYTLRASIGGGSGITPVPATLPLFLTALAGIGFAGWRRRGTGA